MLCELSARTTSERATLAQPAQSCGLRDVAKIARMLPDAAGALRSKLANAGAGLHDERCIRDARALYGLSNRPGACLAVTRPRAPYRKSWIDPISAVQGRR